MTHVISILNMKGGVGKTTTTMMLGEFLAGARNRKVLLVDMDPQVSLSIAVLGEKQWGQANRAHDTLATLFDDALNTGHRPPCFNVDTAIHTNASNVATVTDLDLLPGSHEVIALQAELMALSMATHRSVDVWNILGTGLAPVLHRYDYVLIDCPPSLEIMSKNALRMSEAYVIPTIPDTMSTYGIPLVQQQVRDFAQEEGIAAPRELGVVVTKYRKIAVHHNTMAMLKNRPSAPRLFDPPVPEAGQIAAAAEYHQYPTLKTKYGTDHYRGLWELTEDFRQRVEEDE